MIAFKPVILTTDALIFVLIAVVIGSAWYISRHEHLLAPWKKVGHSRSGMIAAVILLAFVTVGLLDSLHFRPRLPGGEAGKPNYAVDVMSVFDLIAQPLRDKKEKTYSAPLATNLFSKETVELPDGSEARIFPRLAFGGAHLKDPERDFGADVFKRLIVGVALAAVAWQVLLLCVTLWLSHRHGHSVRETWSAIWRGHTTMPWREMLVANGLLFLVIAPMIVLSAKYHVLGTDKVGQDVFYLTLKSIRTGLVIGTLTTLVMLPFALLFGILAGYLRGWVDDVIQYVYTTLNSIPGVLLIAASVLILQGVIDHHQEWFQTSSERADARLFLLCMILGVTSWTGLCRLLRGESLKLRELDYIQAARAFGVSHYRIITRHILPNVMHIVLIAIVMDFSGLILAEAVLSYVGVGVDPSMNSFGTMINAARMEMARDPMVWWSLASAFSFMLLLVLSANLFADAVRDAFDPRIRGRMVSPGFLSKYLPAFPRR
ncbi:MAG TPA: ABC transporter permease [Burkholderiales bacterium]|nr:ABC transporter permease [Burkholderiales bacterium]